MFTALASGPLADDAPVPVSGTSTGVLMLVGHAAGLAPGPSGQAASPLALAGVASARLAVVGQDSLRAAYPEESRTFARLLTGALR